MTRRARPGSRRSFTLTELLVSIALLVGVLLATGKILSTASTVTGMGEANADVMQEVAAVGAQMRADLGRLTREGIFAIRCVAVPNDVNGVTLLDPNLPPEAYIRSDQLLFFTNGNEAIRTFRTGRNADQRAQGSIARVYYGHAFQLSDASKPVDFTPRPRAFDVAPDEVVYPWTNSRETGSIATVRTIFDGSDAGNDIFDTQGLSETDVGQINAPRWIAVRQAVSLMDDDIGPLAGNNKTSFLRDVLTARSIFLKDPYLSDLSPQIRDGRVDGASTQLHNVRHRLLYRTNNSARLWRGGAGSEPDQYELIGGSLLQYPRAELVAPSTNRVDQALTNHVLATACSSIRIDWTYHDGAGFSENPANPSSPYLGVQIDSSRPQPWFGMPDAARFAQSGRVDPDVERGVGAYGDKTWREFPDGDPHYIPAATILPFNQSPPNNIETVYEIGGGVVVYEAFFGLNQTNPLDATGVPHVDMGYTPWPSAIRVTLTLHDTGLRLESGRDVEFVINLPETGR
jgi:hypothetical protein